MSVCEKEFNHTGKDIPKMETGSMLLISLPHAERKKTEDETEIVQFL